MLYRHLAVTPKYGPLLSKGSDHELLITKFELQYLFDLDAMDYRQGQSSSMNNYNLDDS